LRQRSGPDNYSPRPVCRRVTADIFTLVEKMPGLRVDQACPPRHNLLTKVYAYTYHK
jgi:hypothetical protein